MEDPKSRKGVREAPAAGEPQGVGVPAKGDSSSSNPPFDPLEGATLPDIPPTAALASPSPPANPVTREVSPEATISESLAASLKSPANLRRIAQSHTKEAVLQPGDIIGGRYEILQLLGEGGMGAVYKALDRAVERTVALKLIRPELASDPAILARFKQELLTAHQVTHKNVVRIYDLAEAEAIQFITMEFVEGSDLRRILISNGKLPPEKATEIIRQVCLALDAAHSAGVIHRDLKPQNIMQETKTGRIVVMDFGLARSMESEGMTQTGALLGTIEYMSPEQSMGRTLDQRSDIFAVGLIFYEMLTGKTPYKADSAMASLIRRNQEQAVPVAQLESSVPKVLSDIVSKCLERHIENRYQDVQEVLHDLDAFQGARPTLASISLPATVATPSKSAFPWKWVGICSLALLLVGVGVGVAFRLKGPSAAKGPHAPISVLVADFTNHTGDPVFDGTLEPMFNVALEGASFVNAFNRGDARKLAQQLPHPTGKLDEQPARLVAVSQGIGAVVTGELSRRGDKYSLSATALDAVSGNVIANTEVTAANKDEVLLAVPKLVAPIRKALGDTTPESVQLQAAGGAFTASSLEAVHEYGVAMERQFTGNMEDAFKSFSKAAELDPNFARAYAGMAGTSGNLGRQQEAEKYAKLAMEHVDRMTERERYRIRGVYYIWTGNWQKCVQEYSALMKQYPADNIGQNNLASCFASLENMPRALEEGRRAVEIAPKDVMARNNLALYACYAGDFQTCEREGREVRRLSPLLEEGYLILAYAQLGQGQLSQASETYQKLQKVSARGASLAVSGLANLALYEGEYRQAQQILEKGTATDVTAKEPDRAADNFVMLAYAEILLGQKQLAVAAAERALANSQSAKIRFLAARTFVEAGEASKGRKLAASLGQELLAEPQAYAKLIEGEAALKEHDYRQALQLLTEAKNLVDSWIVHFDLGLAYLEAGAFAEADSEFESCIKRRGEALELFMDDMPTYSYFPLVYYYQGRAREGLKSPGFADSYRNYLNIRGEAGEDPLLPEVRRRIAQQDQH
jgi:tetratricopeptide (TPR) repeat protein